MNMRALLAASVLLLVSLTFTPRPAAAQAGAIFGMIRDADTDEPVVAARALAISQDGRTAARSTAGPGGAFRLELLEAGPYTVRVEALGYAPFQRTLVVVGAEDFPDLSVALSRRTYDLDPIVTSVARREEKRLESPAAVEVVASADVREQPAFTLADHVTGVAGVDVIRTGLQGNYVTVRGFNNIFSGATLTLTDNRIASVPSLRANVHHMNPVTNEDIERVEVVLGPGSALYGPNAAHGVVHSMTSSPIDRPGGAISVAAGVRQQAHEVTYLPGLDSAVVAPSSAEPVTHVEGRYAARFGERFGAKLSGQYFAGEEWGFTDAVEAEQRALAQTCRQAGYQVNHLSCRNFSEGLDFARPEDVETLRTSVANVAAGRDGAIRRHSLDLRADWRPADDVSVILAAGRATNANSVDLTGLGAAQVIGWGSEYAQARFRRGQAFGQLFVNRSRNSETYLLRSGRPLHDHSSLLVTQLQNQSRIGERHALTYGVDLLRTVPRTNGTINGRNEGDDDTTEWGVYVQSETALTPRFDLVTAARIDTHDRLADPVVSPRAAFVYRPAEGQNLRFSYNRAFSTPSTLNLFLDISGGTAPLGGPFRYDVRAQGVTEHGMRFARTDGIPDFMSPFGLLLGTGPRHLRPTTTENLWEVAVAVAQASSPEVGAVLASLPVPSAEEVGIDLRLVNMDAGEGESPFLPAPYTASTMADIERLRPTITNTFEVGYKGLVSDRLLLAASAYRTRIDDFTSAPRVSTPNVFLNRADLQTYLEGHGVPGEDAAGIARLIGGEGTHGSPGAPGLPLGVITPEAAGGSEAAIVLTHRNLGTVDLWGADLSATLLFGGGWEMSGNAAWVNGDSFETDGEIVPLNAPTMKGAASLRYREPVKGINGRLRVRHVGGFPARSAVYAGTVDPHTVVDLNLGYRIARFAGLSIQLDVQDLLDGGHRTFVGSPQLGRLAMLRMRYEL